MTDSPFSRPGSDTSQPGDWPYAPPDDAESQPVERAEPAESEPFTDLDDQSSPVEAPRRNWGKLAVAAFVAGTLVGVGATIGINHTITPKPVHITKDSFPTTLDGASRVDQADAITLGGRDFDDTLAGYQFSYGGDGGAQTYFRNGVHRFTLTLVEGRLALRVPETGIAEGQSPKVTLDAKPVQCVYDSYMTSFPAEDNPEKEVIFKYGTTSCLLWDASRNLSIQLDEGGMIWDPSHPELTEPQADPAQTARLYERLLLEVHAQLTK